MSNGIKFYFPSPWKEWLEEIRQEYNERSPSSTLRRLVSERIEYIKRKKKNTKGEV